jgi:hypothetical protein
VVSARPARALSRPGCVPDAAQQAMASTDVP